MISSHHELTSVVVSSLGCDADFISSSAIFLSPRYLLAPGCLLNYTQSSLPTSQLLTKLSFGVIVPVDTLRTKTVNARCVTLWTCRELSAVIGKLFTHDVQTGPTIEETVHIDLLSTFILLEIPAPIKTYIKTEIGELYLGTEILVCSTPFGSSLVSRLYNSWSAGIVSKVIKMDVAYLSDVASAPGGQGGLVFVKDSMTPAGVVIQPVVWQSNVCTGLSVLGSLAVILKSLWNHYKTGDPDNFFTNCTHANTRLGSTKLHLEDRIVRVSHGKSWGSGILLSGSYVLTCSHVVRGHTCNDVLMRIKKFQATVVFRSETEDTFDVAVLKLSEQINGIAMLPLVQQACVGTDISAQGYGLFNQDNSLLVSSGIISKVTSINSHSYRLLITCKTHPGSSGGAVVDNSNNIVAMITSNTYDSSNKFAYPNISWALSLHMMYPSIVALCSSGNLDGFKDLEGILHPMLPISAKL